MRLITRKTEFIKDTERLIREANKLTGDDNKLTQLVDKMAELSRRTLELDKAEKKLLEKRELYIQLQRDIRAFFDENKKDLAEILSKKGDPISEGARRIRKAMLTPLLIDLRKRLLKIQEDMRPIVKEFGTLKQIAEIKKKYDQLYGKLIVSMDVEMREVVEDISTGVAGIDELMKDLENSLM